MYMDLTRTVCKWVSLPEGHQNEVTARETVVFLQRLASLERNGNISARISADWQELYLKTLYALCTNSAQTEKARELRKDAFNKVEAYCLIGLRARSIAWRHKFFSLHCKYIGRTPYERLYYIFHTQDWEALSNTFWLNICVSLILDIVDGKPYPNLAPNSSQLPSLLPERKKAASAEGEKSGPGTEQKAAEAAQGGEKPAAQAEKEGAPAAPAQQSGEPGAAPPQGSGAEKPASGDQPASAAEGGEAAKEKEAAATAVKQDGETPEAAPAGPQGTRPAAQLPPQGGRVCAALLDLVNRKPKALQLCDTAAHRRPMPLWTDLPLRRSPRGCASGLSFRVDQILNLLKF